MKKSLLPLFGLIAVFLGNISLAQPNITISVPKNLENEPLNGRLLLLFSSNPEQEPRFQIEDGPATQ